MTLGYFTKQNSETFFISVDFTDVLETDETIVVGSCTVVAKDVAGADTSSGVLAAGSIAVGDAADGTTDGVLKIKVKAGTEALSPYKITFTAVTSLNNTWEKDIEMCVVEL